MHYCHVDMGAWWHHSFSFWLLSCLLLQSTTRRNVAIRHCRPFLVVARSFIAKSGNLEIYVTRLKFKTDSCVYTVFPFTVTTYTFTVTTYVALFCNCPSSARLTAKTGTATDVRRFHSVGRICTLITNTSEKKDIVGRWAHHKSRLRTAFDRRQRTAPTTIPIG